MARSPRVPKYCLHRASGRAVVYLARRPVYLGVHGTEESKAEYERVVGKWLAGGRPVAPERRPGAVTLAEAVEAYDRHAAVYYRKAGKPTKQLERVRRSLSVAVHLYGREPVTEFDAARLEDVRAAMIRRGWSRTHINHCIGCIKTAFRWLALRRIVPAAVHADLRLLPGLQRGRSDARESAPVQPVPWEHVLPVLRAVPPTVADMIRLQLLTGARPGEVCALRPADLDQGGDVWAYRVHPDANKTDHHGHDRVIFLGPHAQRLLAPYLRGRAPSAYCFSPREAMTARLKALGRRVRTSGYPRCYGERYQRESYQRAILRACRKVGVPDWHSHALRHNAATFLREEFGVDVALAVLGQHSTRVLDIYAGPSRDEARRAIGRVG